MYPLGTHLVKNVFAEDLPTVRDGSGVYVYDTNGKRYLDGCSGAVTANLGHRHPALTEALFEQAQKITFAHRGAFTSEPAEQLAAVLSSLTGYPYVFLCGSGSEAVEAAVKFVLQYWKEVGASPAKQNFYSHAIGYHGATLGALSLSGHPRRREVAEALLFPFNTLTPPYHYRFGNGRSEDEFTDALLDVAATTMHADPASAAIVLEPVGGAAGGAITPPDRYLPGLAEICAASETLFVADEVMCGLGRTGRVLACEHWSIKPDLVVLGKGLGAGYAPISAVLLSQAVYDALDQGTRAITNGHTYGGNPLSCAVALASLNVLMTDGLVAHADRLGADLRAGLEDLGERYSLIGEVRGRGLLQALELVSDPRTRAPGDPVGSLTQQVVTASRNAGLLVYPANGGLNDAVLVAPPLTASFDEVDELLGLLDSVLHTVSPSRDHAIGSI